MFKHEPLFHIYRFNKKMLDNEPTFFFFGFNQFHWLKNSVIVDIVLDLKLETGMLSVRYMLIL